MKIYVKHAGERRFRNIDKDVWFNRRDAAAAYVAKHRPANSTSEWQIRDGAKILVRYAPSADPRALEMPVGRNEQVLRDILGRIHVGRSHLDAIREILRGAMGMAAFRKLPPQLKRGLIVAICKIHDENRALYRQVMGARS